MAAPFTIWPSGYSGFPNYYMPQGYAVPEIPPSAVSDGALRDYTEHCLSGDRRSLCDSTAQSLIQDWSKDDDKRKIIMEVIKSRIDLPWPYNYKSLDLLTLLPIGEIVGLYDKIKALSEAPGSVEGAAELKKIAKPLVDKADAEKKKGEEEEAKKKQDAIMAMWGPLWANTSYTAPAALAGNGYYGWQYPYPVVPGVPAQSAIQWESKAPEGWKAYVMTPVPCVPFINPPPRPTYTWQRVRVW